MDTWNTPVWTTEQDASYCEKKGKNGIGVTLSNDNNSSIKTVLNSSDISIDHDIKTNNTSKRSCCSS